MQQARQFKPSTCKYENEASYFPFQFLPVTFITGPHTGGRGGVNPFLAPAPAPACWQCKLAPLPATHNTPSPSLFPCRLPPSLRMVHALLRVTLPAQCSFARMNNSSVTLPAQCSFARMNNPHPAPAKRGRGKTNLHSSLLLRHILADLAFQLLCHREASFLLTSAILSHRGTPCPSACYTSARCFTHLRHLHPERPQPWHTGGCVHSVHCTRLRPIDSHLPSLGVLQHASKHNADTFGLF